MRGSTGWRGWSPGRPRRPVSTLPGPPPRRPRRVLSRGRRSPVGRAAARAAYAARRFARETSCTTTRSRRCARGRRRAGASRSSAGRASTPWAALAMAGSRASRGSARSRATAAAGRARHVGARRGRPRRATGGGRPTRCRRWCPAYFGLRRPAAVTEAIYLDRIAGRARGELAPSSATRRGPGTRSRSALVDDVADELAAFAIAAIRRLHLARSPVPVVLAGGLARGAADLLVPAVERRVHGSRRAPCLCPRRPRRCSARRCSGSTASPRPTTPRPTACGRCSPCGAGRRSARAERLLGPHPSASPPQGVDSVAFPVIRGRTILCAENVGTCERLRGTSVAG